MNVISPFSRPLYVMLKPVGSVCNLACDYCYYLEKGKLYPETKNTVMSEQLLEKWRHRQPNRSCSPGMVARH